MATGTIPMLCFGVSVASQLCFVPLERELPAEMDPELNCSAVINKVMPAFKPDADVRMPCVVVEEPCSARRGSKNKCKGGEWQ